MDEAHRLYGRILLRVGPPLIVFTVLAKLLVPSEILTLALLPFPLAALIIPIPMVEKRLKAMGGRQG